MTIAEIRPYTDDDAQLVVDYVYSAAELDPSLEPSPLEAWRAYTAMSYNNGARDFALAMVDGEVAALLQSTRMEDEGEVYRQFRIIVHPSFRRRGIADALFRHVEQQDPDGGATLRCSCMGAWKAGIGFVERRGFELDEQLHWMRFDAEPPPAAPPPDGVVLRPYRGEADNGDWCRLNAEGYSGSSHYTELTSGDIEAFRAEPRFHLWIAEAAGRPVGLCHTNDFGGQGCVNSVVVSPGFRSRGLGRALLLAGMHTLWEEDHGPMRLSVLAENSHAVTLYRSVGFVTDDEVYTYVRRPRPPADVRT